MRERGQLLRRGLQLPRLGFGSAPLDDRRGLRVPAESEMPFGARRDIEPDVGVGRVRDDRQLIDDACPQLTGGRAAFDGPVAGGRENVVQEGGVDVRVRIDAKIRA